VCLKKYIGDGHSRDTAQFGAEPGRHRTKLFKPCDIGNLNDGNGAVECDYAGSFRYRGTCCDRPGDGDNLFGVTRSAQNRFYFLQFHSIASNLDLVIHSSQIIQATSCMLSDHVSGSVPVPFPSRRQADELLLRFLWFIPVARGYLRAAQT